MEKIYRIQSKTGHFITGTAQDHTQMLMAPFTPDMTCVLFDQEGNLLRYITRSFSETTEAAWRRIKGEPGSSLHYTLSWQEVDDWAAELGMVQGTIAVRKFSIPELDLRIQDLPEGLQELLDSGNDLDDEEQAWLCEWQESQYYQLVWGNDYDIDVDGKVIST